MRLVACSSQARSSPSSSGLRRRNTSTWYSLIQRNSAGLSRLRSIQAGIERHVGQTLEAQHRQLTNLFQLGHDYQVLAADAKAIFTVVARLVGEHHARLQGNHAPFRRDALGAFMHA